MKKTLVALTFALIVSPLLASGPYVPTDAERARWTMQDMASWRICFEAYKQDHSKYPEVKTAAEAKAAFEPVYVAHLPINDAWGRPYAVESSAERYTIASSGADGKFDRQSWTKGATLLSFNDDAVATEEGRWLLRRWSLK